MVKCSICGREAIYVSRGDGRAYCRRHFLRYFDRKVKKVIRRYGMFGKEERIVVAVSGGKDSLSLLHYLHNLAKKVPRWEVKALLIDEGISGYRDVTIKDFRRVVNELGIDGVVVSFKEVFGYSLDEIIRLGRERGLPYLPCTYCGVLRRYLLNKAARELGGTVLATAHNLDDVIQTFIMNVIRNSWDKVVRLGPVSGIQTHPKFVRRVKPFYEVLEKETTLYAILNDLYPREFVECPYARTNIRWYVRKYLNKLEELNPGIKYSILNSLLTIINVLKEAGLGSEGEVSTCLVCGEPSANPVCRACLLRYELGILEVPEGIRHYVDELVSKGRGRLGDLNN